MLEKILSIIVLSVIGLTGFFFIYKLEKRDEKNSELTSINYSDWSEETHSKEANTNYETVFPQDQVNRLDIVISEENWQIMQDDLDTLYGSSTGTKGGMPEDSSENPVFVESQVFFNDTQWYNVGIRFKGNSSLRSAYQSGVAKLPFKLSFDEYEDEYPDLNNQRFYGFKELSLSSNFQDTSFIHEKLATEAFDLSGVVSPESAFYEVYVDYGEGSTYFGLYTAVEVIDESFIEENFDDEDGNVYKAEGDASSFSESTATSLQTDFIKKSNEDENDWSDLDELSELLHSDLRESDYDAWKDDLEDIFDVDTFLNWLAVNTVIQNWDTYGNMTHNYYLYTNPETEQLTWIPWDNNESFSNGKKTPVSLTFNEVSEDWPLIRYIIDDEEYREEYVSYVEEFSANILNSDDFRSRVSDLHILIEPYVIGENGEQEGYTFLRNEDEFINSETQLLSFITERVELASQVTMDSNWEYDPSSITEVQGEMRRPGPRNENMTNEIPDAMSPPERMAPPEGMEAEEEMEPPARVGITR